MRHAGLKIIEAQTADPDDRSAMSAALHRLYGAANRSVQEIVASLTASERARLAVFCYGRVHLNATGLAIAATCELDHLVAATHSATAGRTLFSQSRASASATDKPLGRRTPISLATSVSSRQVGVYVETAAEAAESLA
jgi:hypothetical protein